MSFHVYSDIVIEPFLAKVDFGLQTSFFYEEDLLTATQKIREQKPKFALVHFDVYFNSKQAYYQQLVTQLHEIGLQTSTTILVPTQFGFFKTGALNSGNSLVNNPIFAGSDSNLITYDFAFWIAQIGLAQAYHFALGHVYQMPYTKSVQAIFATNLQLLISKLINPDKKVLVLDCDNTLWKGVVGEDGIDGIAIGKDANGIAYLHFQEFLVTKKQEGFILCLCSKNNEEDVKNVFEQRRMPLKWDDFIIKKINWTNKTQNLQEIAMELNVGLDSFIFIDDSDFEIQSVKTLLPQITCLQFTGNYQQVRNLFDNPIFYKKVITTDDLQKTAQYQAEEKRKNVATSASNMQSFIQSLDLKLTVFVNQLDQFERLAQLTEKTNQFNFNKIPYTIADLTEIVNNNGFIISASLSDMYGEYGIIGLIILTNNANNNLHVHNYLMSCRALGRGVELDFWNQMLEIVQKQNKKIEHIDFVQTLKNEPANLFLQQINFKA